MLRDLLKISVKAGAISSAASFGILACTSSGPEALCSSRSFNSFNTVNFFIVGIHGNVRSMMTINGSSSVKTDWNCS